MDDLGGKPTIFGNIHMHVFPYLYGTKLSEFGGEPIFESEAKGENNLPKLQPRKIKISMDFFPPSCSRTEVTHSPWTILVCSHHFCRLHSVASNWWRRGCGSRNRNSWFLLPHLLFNLSSPNGDQMCGPRANLEATHGRVKACLEISGVPSSRLRGHPTPVNPWSGRGTFRAITLWHACSTLFIFTRAHLTAFLLTLTVANAFRWTYEGLMEKKNII